MTAIDIFVLLSEPEAPKSKIIVTRKCLPPYGTHCPLCYMLLRELCGFSLGIGAHEPSQITHIFVFCASGHRPLHLNSRSASKEHYDALKSIIYIYMEWMFECQAFVILAHWDHRKIVCACKPSGYACAFSCVRVRAWPKMKMNIDIIKFWWILAIDLCRFSWRMWSEELNKKKKVQTKKSRKLFRSGKSRLCPTDKYSSVLKLAPSSYEMN